MGDLNVNMYKMNYVVERKEETMALISSLGLIDIQKHFKQKNNLRWTWKQDRKGKTIQSICDYILLTNRNDFKNVCIKDPNNYDSDHMMLVATIILNNDEQHINNRIFLIVFLKHINANTLFLNQLKLK